MSPFLIKHLPSYRKQRERSAKLHRHCFFLFCFLQRSISFFSERCASYMPVKTILFFSHLDAHNNVECSFYFKDKLCRNSFYTQLSWASWKSRHFCVQLSPEKAQQPLQSVIMMTLPYNVTTSCLCDCWMFFLILFYFRLALYKSIVAMMFQIGQKCMLNPLKEPLTSILVQ